MAASSRWRRLLATLVAIFRWLFPPPPPPPAEEAVRLDVSFDPPRKKKAP